MLGIEAALHAGLVPVKLNVAVLRNMNTGELVEIARFGLERGCQVRFLELMPIGPIAERFDDFFVSSAEVLTKLCQTFDLRPASERPGVSSRDYLARDAFGREGIIGLISSHSNPFCRGCRRLRLTATGRLIGCLARGEGPIVRPFLEGEDSPDAEALVEAVREALRLKRNGRVFSTTSLMANVGG